MDGGCLVSSAFILTHSRLAVSGKFVAGARSYIKRRCSGTMVAAGPAGRSIRRFVWFWRALFAQANRPFQLLSLPVNWRRNRNPEQWQKVQTCNLAVWRADVDRVEGFDNTSTGHGLAASDFALRLLRAGVTRRPAERPVGKEGVRTFKSR